MKASARHTRLTPTSGLLAATLLAVTMLVGACGSNKVVASAPTTTTILAATTTSPGIDPSITAPPDVTTRPIPAGACAGKMSNSSPAVLTTVNLLITSNLPSASITATEKFSGTTRVHHGKTDGNGAATVPISVGKSSAGLRVELAIVFDRALVACSTTYVAR